MQPGNDLEQRLAHFFKPEVRKAGSDLLAKGVVFLQRGSDRQVEAFVRTSTAAKVFFWSESIEDLSFSVDCSCNASKKGQLCKHVWATFLLAQEKSPDFLSSKTSLEKQRRDEREGAPAIKPAELSESRLAAQASLKARQEDMKQKQSDYRKHAYQAQKKRVKEIKAAQKSDSGKTKSDRKSTMFAAALPDEVLEAVKYFEFNGFPMTAPVPADEVNNAKRVLSRVFHPDKGGSHEEILELLRHSKVLLEYG